jgi:AcrR family transcriptional regulator
VNGGTARERILGALVELLAEDGFDALTTERVIARAEASRAQFEAAFGDLESVLLAALDDTAEHAIRRMRRVAAHTLRGSATADAGERIELAFEPTLRELLECAAATPALTRACVVEVATIGERGLARRDAALERFVQLLDGSLPDLPDRPSQLASEMVVGGIHELLQRRALAGDIAGLPELAPALTAVWLPVLRGAR